MAPGNGRRLDSWKEIADYLGRNASTVRRWEGEKHLPVHRVPGGRRQNVFAYREEIDRWLSEESDQEAEAGDGKGALRASPASQVATARRWRATPWMVAGLALPVIAAVLSLTSRRAQLPCLIVQNYSEIDHQGSGVVLLTDGSRLYFETDDGGIREVPANGGRAVTIPVSLRNIRARDICASRSEILLGNRRRYGPGRPSLDIPGSRRSGAPRGQHSWRVTRHVPRTARPSRMHMEKASISRAGAAQGLGKSPLCPDGRRAPAGRQTDAHYGSRSRRSAPRASRSGKCHRVADKPTRSSKDGSCAVTSCTAPGRGTALFTYSIARKRRERISGQCARPIRRGAADASRRA